MFDSTTDARTERFAPAWGATALALVASVVSAGAAAYLLGPMGWPATTGVVHSSIWMDTTGNDSRGACITYSYSVDGVPYHSDRLSLFRSSGKYDAGSGQWEWDERAMVRDHPSGSAIEVRYDPRQHSRSVVVAHANMPGVWGAGAVVALLWFIAGHTWLKALTARPGEEPGLARAE